MVVYDGPFTDWGWVSISFWLNVIIHSALQGVAPPHPRIVGLCVLRAPDVAIWEKCTGYTLIHMEVS